MTASRMLRGLLIVHVSKIECVSGRPNECCANFLRRPTGNLYDDFVDDDAARYYLAADDDVASRFDA